MTSLFEHRHVVRPDEIDVLRHANNLCYLRWMLAAATSHSAALGWNFERYQALGSGWVVRSHQITYLRPALEGEEIVVATWVASTRRVTSLRRYKMRRTRDGALLAEAATDWAFVQFATGRVTRIPPDVVAAYPVLGDAPPGA